MNVHIEQLPSDPWVGNLLPFQVTFDRLSPLELQEVLRLFQPFVGPPLPMPIPELRLTPFVSLKQVAAVNSVQYRSTDVVVEVLLHNIRDIPADHISLYWAPGLAQITRGN